MNCQGKKGLFLNSVCILPKLQLVFLDYASLSLVNKPHVLALYHLKNGNMP